MEIRTRSIRATTCRTTPPLTCRWEKASARARNTSVVDRVECGHRRVLLDNSLTFGGFHFNDPRQIYVEFRYRFHY